MGSANREKPSIVCIPLSDIWTEQFYLPQRHKVKAQIGCPDW